MHVNHLVECLSQDQRSELGGCYLLSTHISHVTTRMYIYLSWPLSYDFMGTAASKCGLVYVCLIIYSNTSLIQQKQPVKKSSQVPLHDTMGNFSYNYTLKSRLVFGCFCSEHVYHPMVAFTGLIRVR